MTTTYQTLAAAIVPIHRDQAQAYITRFLAHYPGRDVTKDAIIISDLTFQLVKRGASAYAVFEVLEGYWTNSTSEKPFLPATGSILNACLGRTTMYQVKHAEIENLGQF